MKWKLNGIFSAEECSPIPITAEILEKNGIKPVSQTLEDEEDGLIRYLICDKDCAHTLYQLQYDNFIIYSWDNVCNIYTIHQLQHALHLCGLTELADNFKIA